MSLKPSLYSSQQPSSSTGSNESPISIGQRKWFGRLLAAVGLYLLFLPLWWYSLPLLTNLSAFFADLIYHFFDPQVAIKPINRMINFTVTATQASGFGGQKYETGLQMDTVTYGLPMLIALIVVTGADSLRAKLQALVIGVLVMSLLTVPVVMLWAKLASLEMEEKIAQANLNTSGDRSSFLFYVLQGGAFSQPVLAVLIWLGMMMLGLFKAKTQEQTAQSPIARNAACPCGSGRKYKRCCGRAGN
jgi:hypothetical protein